MHWFSNLYLKLFPINAFIQKFMEEWNSFQLLLQCDKNAQERQIQNMRQIFWSDKTAFYNYWTKKKFKQNTFILKNDVLLCGIPWLWADPVISLAFEASSFSIEQVCWPFFIGEKLKEERLCNGGGTRQFRKMCIFTRFSFLTTNYYGAKI